MSGSRKVTTPYEISFLDPVPWRSLCEDYLDATDVRIHLASSYNILVPSSLLLLTIYIIISSCS